MDNTEKGLLNLKAEKRVRRALAKLLREIKNEPRLILEIGNDTQVDTVDGILSWLFGRRNRDDNSRN